MVGPQIGFLAFLSPMRSPKLLFLLLNIILYDNTLPQAYNSIKITFLVSLPNKSQKVPKDGAHVFTDGRTYGRTYGWRDIPGYRVASTRLKMVLANNMVFLGVNITVPE